MLFCSGIYIINSNGKIKYLADVVMREQVVKVTVEDNKIFDNCEPVACKKETNNCVILFYNFTFNSSK